MAGRNYSDTVPATTLVGPGGGSATGLTSGGTAMELSAPISGAISVPFALRLEPGTPNEEVVLVTAGAGTSGSPYTITRGQGSTTAKTHTTGSTVTHGIYSTDFSDVSTYVAHAAASKAVHGLSVNQKVSGSYIGQVNASVGGGVSSTAEFVCSNAFTIPANEMVVGGTYRFMVGGQFTWITPAKVTIRVRAGGLTGAILVAYTQLTPTAGGTWRLEAESFVGATGGSGSIRTVGSLDVPTGSTAITARQLIVSGNVTVDTTVSQDIVATAQWDTSNAGNNLLGFHAYLERQY